MLDVLSGRKITLLRCVVAALRVSISILGNFGAPSQTSQLLRTPPTPSLSVCICNNVFQMTSCPTWSFVCVLRLERLC